MQQVASAIGTVVLPLATLPVLVLPFLTSTSGRSKIPATSVLLEMVTLLQDITLLLFRGERPDFWPFALCGWLLWEVASARNMRRF
jgi:hypothetical protein